MDPDEKFDFELSDGSKGNIDKSKLTVRDWRRFWAPDCTDAEGDAILSKVTGWPQDRIQSLLFDDYRRLCRSLREKCTAPLDDPKVSGSSSG